MKNLHLSIRMYCLKNALICFKERQAGLKKSVRTLLNLSVQKGEDIVYLHSSALCLHFVFGIIFPTVLSWDPLAFLMRSKSSCQTEKGTCSASIW